MKRILILLLFPLLCLQVKAIAFDVPRLSPMPEGDKRERICLDGEWQFSTSVNDQFNGMDAKGFQKIQVPGEWVMQGFQVPKNAKAGYVRSFFIGNESSTRRVK